MTTLTKAQREVLETVQRGDLRFWVPVMDIYGFYVDKRTHDQFATGVVQDVMAAGYVEKVTVDYIITYALTDAGRAALEAKS